MTIAEAHAVGRPTVVYDAGGPRDIVNDENGILVAELKPELIAEAILKIWNNYESYNHELISKNCYNKFSEEVICRKLEVIYEATLKQI